MWIARDKDGLLCVYDYKPSKGREVWLESTRGLGAWTLPKEWFPEIKWEDEEPWEFVLKQNKRRIEYVFQKKMNQQESIL